MESKKIGVFDSGIGGVTVLKEIIKILPNEDYIYFSDSINNPYGEKDDEKILEICDKITQDYAYDKPTLVMATKGTIESEKFHILYEKYDNHQTYLLPCIGLADIIEEGNYEKIKQYLQKNISIYKGKVENVVLGCTHYPLIQKEIGDVLGNVKFFQGATNLAKHLKNVLEEKNLLENNAGNLQFIDSQMSEEKEERFFNILKQ